MRTKPSFSEKIAVVTMFGLVLLVFSFASRDTDKWKELRSHSAAIRIESAPAPVAVLQANQTSPFIPAK